MTGPLEGLKIVELGGMGPGPFAGMMFADHGADVMHIARRSAVPERGDFFSRGKRSLAIDLKSPDGAAAVLDLISDADVVIEGFRPGVAERLGLGPADCFARNEALVYGRMTGWGQDGPLSATAGHDINYISLSGALEAIGLPGDRPVPPLNLVGGYGGGAMFLAFGIFSALHSARATGKGQVVDAAMADAATVLMTQFYDIASRGGWGPRGTNMVDGGAHFYGTYETSDGKYVAVGPVEPQFYAELLEKLDLADAGLPEQMDAGQWPASRERIAEKFLTRTRDEWTEEFANADACFSPVLGIHEAPSHPSNIARRVFVEVEGQVQPAPAPRYDGTPTRQPSLPPVVGEHTLEVLAEAGFDDVSLERLRATGAIS